MRVGLFSDYYLANNDGTAIATHITRSALEARRHDVYIICPRLRSTPTDSKTITLPSLPGLIYPGMRLVWPLSRRRLEKVKRLELDVIHIQTPLLSGLFGFWAGRKLKIPIIISAHLDLDFLEGYRLGSLAGLAFATWIVLVDRRLLNFLKYLRAHRRSGCTLVWLSFGYLSDQCDAVIAISNKMYQQLSGLVSLEKLWLVPNGTETPQPTPTKKTARRRLGMVDSDFVILSASRLVKEKRVELVIEALARLNKTYPHARLIVLNDGPQRHRLETMAAQAGLADKVTFTGFVDRKELQDYYSAADVFVNASLNEVASLSILEAASAGLPLALFDKRLSEPLQDGVNGFLVKDSSSLTRKLSWLAKHPAETVEMSRASRRRAANFSVGAHVKALESVYRSVIQAG